LICATEVCRSRQPEGTPAAAGYGGIHRRAARCRRPQTTPPGRRWDNRDVRLNHILLWVTDVARSLEFYEGKLRFVRIEADEGYARLRAPEGEATLGLHEASETAPPPWNDGVGLYIEVDDVDTLCRRLAEQGVSFDQEPEDMAWGWRHAYLRDPDGHRLSIYHAGEKRFQPTPA